MTNHATADPPEKVYPALWQLFGGYLFVDFDLMNASTSEAIEEFLDEDLMAEKLGEDIVTLLDAIKDDGDLAAFCYDKLSLGYMPDSDGVSLRDFLNCILTEANERASEAKKQ